LQSLYAKFFIERLFLPEAAQIKFEQAIHDNPNFAEALNVVFRTVVNPQNVIL
jgi:hypothetical protein